STALIGATPRTAELEATLAPHRFRMINHRVETDLAEPRVCMTFSERLGVRPLEAPRYFLRDGKRPEVVRIDDRQACVGGLTHGQTHTIQVVEGLPSNVDETLPRAVSLRLYVRDRPAKVSLPQRAYVLPRGTGGGLPITHINTRSVAIEVLRVTDASLVSAILDGRVGQSLNSYSADRLRDSLAVPVWSGTMDVRSARNEASTTAFPVTKTIGALEPGVYAAKVRPVDGRQEEWADQATQWFIVSDLGLTALSAPDGMHVFVRGLGDAKPVADAHVRVMARNNEVLAAARSDADGYVFIGKRLIAGSGALTPAVLTARVPRADQTGSVTGSGTQDRSAQDSAATGSPTQGNTEDYAFLDLTSAAFDLTDRGVEGRTVPGQYDVYLRTERGVYRPGAQVHLTALVRSAQSVALPRAPLEARLERPDGVLHARTTLDGGAAGGHAWSMQLPPAAVRGTWRVRITALGSNDTLAENRLLVEDFEPERIDMQLTAPEIRPVAGSAVPIGVQAKYLFGVPAANMALSADVAVRVAKKGDPAYPGYRFGLDDVTPPSARAEQANAGRTDQDGAATALITLPATEQTDRPLEAAIRLRLREAGGKAIERTVTVPVASSAPRIGIKPLFKAGEIGDGAPATFDIITVPGADGTALPANARLTWQLFRLQRRYQWYGSGGSWQYEPIDDVIAVGQGTVDGPLPSADAPARLLVEITGGRYRLEVSAAQEGARAATLPASSTTFTAGWWSDKGPETPEIIEVGTDQPAYEAGDEIAVTFQAPTNGRAVVTLLSSGIQARREVAAVAGQNTVTMTVGDGWGPGGYIAVMFHAGLDVDRGRMPARAIGVRWIGLGEKDRTLKVSIGGQDRIGSDAAHVLPVQVDGANGQPVHLVVTAVDQGILNLTDHPKAAATDHYFGQRRLDTEFRDLYGRLINGMGHGFGRVRSGGDGVAGLQLKSAPERSTSLVIFSGLVTTDDTGAAQIPINVPAFSGALRVDAVAWTDARVGQASRELIVADPLAMLTSAPAFLSLGDSGRLGLDLRHVSGPTGAFEVTIERTLGSDATAQSDAPAVVETLANRIIELSDRQGTYLSLPVTATKLGTMQLTAIVVGPQGTEYRRQVSVPVTPPAAVVTRSTSQTIAPGGRLVLDANALTGLIGARAQVSVAGGLMGQWDIAGAYAGVTSYPYGCAEQTISRALPLLYLSDVADQLLSPATSTAHLALNPDLANTGGGLDARVEAAISRVLTLQNGAGGFGLWSPYTPDLWLTAYVADFLSRAVRRGYQVPEGKLRLALDRLQNEVNYAGDLKQGGEKIA
ncbi:MAG: MG2 domain-containing protein, partial [Pseudomonadota bacterium]